MQFRTTSFLWSRKSATFRAVGKLIWLIPFVVSVGIEGSTTVKRSAIVMASLFLATAACSPGGTLAEQVLESQEGIENVEIDEDTGEVKIEVEGEDGGSLSVGGGEVPDDFPIPIPDGGEIRAVFETEDEANVQASYGSGDFDAIKAFYEDWSASAGEVQGTFETSDPPTFSVTVIDGDRSYSISVAQVGDEVIVNAFAGRG